MQFKGCGIYVLIETLWNVKFDVSWLNDITFTVLIETLWNVKISTPIFFTTLASRINRNIMECKAF